MMRILVVLLLVERTATFLNGELVNTVNNKQF